MIKNEPWYKELDKLANNVITAKGRYHSQVAMCELGEHLGYEMVWPTKEKNEDKDAN